MTLVLTDDQKYGMFKMLLTKTTYEAGLEFGLDKHYKTSRQVQNYVTRIFNEVKNNPDKFNVNKEVYDGVLAARASRTLAIKKTDASLREKTEIDENDIKALMIGNRNDVAKILRHKLEKIKGSAQQINNLSLLELAKVFGILFDKGQIIQGEATEHIAHLAKIESGLTSEQLLQAVINQREHAITKKNE